MSERSYFVPFVKVLLAISVILNVFMLLRPVFAIGFGSAARTAPESNIASNVSPVAVSNMEGVRLDNPCPALNTAKAELEEIERKVEANLPLSEKFLRAPKNPYLSDRLKLFWSRKAGSISLREISNMECHGTFCQVRPGSSKAAQEILDDNAFYERIISMELEPDTNVISFETRKEGIADGLSLLNDLAAELRRTNGCPRNKDDRNVEMVLQIVEETPSSAAWLEVQMPVAFTQNHFATCLEASARRMIQTFPRPEKVAKARLFVMFD